ncbi:hypothetical protein GQ53DRAFT_824779 [Thozetella sp. PMI_491]|nr:hypothetical protein GQ53DRAFT_824779 [Thozetella sp. PMI_491]
MFAKLAVFVGLGALVCGYPKHHSRESAGIACPEIVQYKQPIVLPSSFDTLIAREDQGDGLNNDAMTTTTLVMSLPPSTQTVMATQMEGLEAHAVSGETCLLTINFDGMDQVAHMPILIGPEQLEHLKEDLVIATLFPAPATKVMVMPTSGPSCTFTFQGHHEAKTFAVPTSVTFQDLIGAFALNLPKCHAHDQDVHGRGLGATVEDQSFTPTTSNSALLPRETASPAMNIEHPGAAVVEAHYHLANGDIVTKIMTMTDFVEISPMPSQVSMVAENHSDAANAGFRDNEDDEDDDEDEDDDDSEDDYLALAAAFMPADAFGSQPTSAPSIADFDAINLVIVADISKTLQYEGEARSMGAPSGMFDTTAEAKTTSTQTLRIAASTETVHYVAANSGKPEIKVVTSVVPGDLVQKQVYSLANGSFSTATTTIHGAVGTAHADGVAATKVSSAPHTTWASAALLCVAAVIGAAIFA